MLIDLRAIPLLWFGGIKPGRADKLTGWLNKLGLCHIHIDPVIHENGVIGCKESAKKTLIESLKYNDPVLILEDDCAPTCWYNPIIELPDDADALYVGTSVRGLIGDWQYKNFKKDTIWHGIPRLKQEYKNVFKIDNMLSTHAIVYITERYKQYCYNIIHYCVIEEMPYDVIYAAGMKKFNIYAVKKPLFFQDCDCYHTREDTTRCINELKNFYKL